MSVTEVATLIRTAEDETIVLTLSREGSDEEIVAEVTMDGQADDNKIVVNEKLGLTFQET